RGRPACRGTPRALGLCTGAGGWRGADGAQHRDCGHQCATASTVDVGDMIPLGARVQLRGLPGISGTGRQGTGAADTTDTALKPLTEKRVHPLGGASTRANGKFPRAVTNHSFDFWLWAKEQHEAEGKPGHVQVVEQLWNSAATHRLTRSEPAHLRPRPRSFRTAVSGV